MLGYKNNKQRKTCGKTMRDQLGRLAAALIKEHPDHENRTEDEKEYCTECNPPY